MNAVFTYVIGLNLKNSDKTGGVKIKYGFLL